MYARLVDAWAWTYEDQDVRIVGTIPENGIQGASPRRRHRPARYGTNVWALPRARGEVAITIQGDELGDYVSPAMFGARLVRETAGDVVYTPIPFDGLTGSLVVPDVTSYDRHWIVIGSWTPQAREPAWFAERFSYTLDVDITAPKVTPPAPEEPAQACACTTGSPSPALGWLPLWLGVHLRRRRRR